MSERISFASRKTLWVNSFGPIRVNEAFKAAAKVFAHKPSSVVHGSIFAVNDAAGIIMLLVRIIIVKLWLIAANNALASNNEEVRLFDWEALQLQVDNYLADSECDKDKLLCFRDTKGNATKKLCSCEPKCTEYGDCCFDYARKHHNQTKSLNLKSKDVVNCVQWMGDLHIFAISQCPLHYENALVRQKCASSGPSASHSYMQDIPVESALTHQVYANFFCAICHNDMNVTVPRGLVKCNNEDLLEDCGISPLRDILTPDNYGPKHLQWTRILGQYGIDPLNNCSHSASYSLTCSMSFTPEALPNVRFCKDKSRVINECPREMHDHHYYYCKLYALPIIGPRGYRYVNPHCAKCQGIRLNDTLCSAAAVSPHHGEGGARSANSISRSRNFLTNSFWETGAEAQLLSVQLDFLQLQSNCKTDPLIQFWDPLEQQCYNISCGFFFESSRDGGCRFRNVTRQRSLDCEYTAELRRWEVREFPNGSIFHYKKKILYELEEYEIFHMQAEASKSASRVYKVCGAAFKEDYLLDVNIIQGPLGSAFLWMSVICQVVHISIFTALKKLRNPPAQNLLALTCSLCPAQLLVIAGLRYEASHSICVFIATCLHYLFLAAAFWMNVLHFDLCRVCFKRSALNKVSSSAREANRAKFRFKMYSYYAWGIPVLIVSGGHLCGNLEILRDYSPDYAARTFCWINSQTGLALFFALPMATLLLENAIFIGITVICLLQSQRQAYIQGDHSSQTSQTSVRVRQRKMGQDESKDGFVVDVRDQGVKFKESEFQAKAQARLLTLRFGSYGLLGLILGVPWVVAFAKVFSNIDENLWYPFVILQGLQGITIFLLFDLKKKIYYMAYEKVMGRPHSAIRKQRLLKAETKVKRNHHNNSPPPTSAARPRIEAIRKSIGKQQSCSFSAASSTEEDQTSLAGAAAQKLESHSPKSEQASSAKQITIPRAKTSLSRGTSNNKSLSSSRKLGRDLAQFDAWQQLKIFQQRLHMENATAMAAAGQGTDEDEDEYLPALARVIANNNQDKQSLPQITVAAEKEASEESDNRTYFHSSSNATGRRSRSQPPSYINPPPYRPRGRLEAAAAARKSIERSCNLTPPYLTMSDDESLV